MTKTKPISMSDIYNNPHYRGKHVIIAFGKIFTAKTGEGATVILEKLEKKDPKEIPTIAYIPKNKLAIYDSRF
jgi:hypothetical protein